MSLYASGEINGALRGLSEYQMPTLWQISEWYLDTGGKGYKVSKINNDILTLERNTKTENWLSSILKIVSYISFILPILAYAIRASYREQYQYKSDNDDVVEEIVYDAPATSSEIEPYPMRLPDNDPNYSPAIVNTLNMVADSYNRSVQQLADLEKQKQDDLIISAQAPKRISDGKEYDHTDYANCMVQIGKITSNFISFLILLRGNKDQQKLIEASDKFIEDFCEVYNSGTYMTQDIDPNRSQMAAKIDSLNHSVRGLSTSIHELGEQIVERVIAPVYKDRENPPQKFVSPSESEKQAVECLKNLWYARLLAVSAGKS